MRSMSRVHQNRMMLPQVPIRESAQIVDIDERIAGSLNDGEWSAATPYRLDLIDAASGKTIPQHPESRLPVGSCYHARQSRSPIQPATKHSGSIGKHVAWLEHPSSRQIHDRRDYKAF